MRPRSPGLPTSRRDRPWSLRNAAMGTRPAVHPAVPPGLRARAELRPARGSRRDAGTWIEDKGEAVAVHTRRAAEPQAELDRLRGPLAELAAGPGWRWSRAGSCSSCGRPARTREKRSASWRPSDRRLRFCSAATTSATGPPSRRCGNCAPRARQGCWSSGSAEVPRSPPRRTSVLAGQPEWLSCSQPGRAFAASGSPLPPGPGR